MSPKKHLKEAARLLYVLPLNKQSEVLMVNSMGTSLYIRYTLWLHEDLSELEDPVCVGSGIRHLEPVAEVNVEAVSIDSLELLGAPYL